MDSEYNSCHSEPTDEFLPFKWRLLYFKLQKKLRKCVCFRDNFDIVYYYSCYCKLPMENYLLKCIFGFWISWCTPLSDSCLRHNYRNYIKYQSTFLYCITINHCQRHHRELHQYNHILVLFLHYDLIIFSLICFPIQAFELLKKFHPIHICAWHFNGTYNW